MTEKFVHSLARLLSDNNSEDKSNDLAEKLVRKIDTDPNKRGDFALPSLDNGKVWKFGVNDKVFENVDEANRQLVWPIQSAVTKGNTLILRLNRAAVFRETICQIVQSGLEVENDQKPFQVVNHELQRDNSPQMSKLRTIQVSGVISRLLQKCGYYRTTDFQSDGLIVKIGCSDLCHLKEDDNSWVVPFQVGHVIDGRSKQKHSGNFGDIYQAFYSNLLGVAKERSEGDVMTQNVHQTAAAEIQFQLHAKNLRMPAALDPEKCDQASFVLYNNARIIQIFNAFHNSCQIKPSEQLPDVASVDFDLLAEDEEWELLFNSVLPYLDFVQSVRNEPTSAALSNVNKICAVMIGLANCFSKYYRRVRILKNDPQPQTLRVMHARLYLILVLRIVNQHAFDILGIRALKQM